MDDATTKDPVIQRILRWAENQELVRAVLLTGSRAAATAVDALSDYDLILYTSDPAPLLTGDSWLGDLGRILVRLPCAAESRTRLVIYEDGTKVDFTILPAAALRQAARGTQLPVELDAGYSVLLDKDGAASGLRPPSGTAFVPKPPTQQEFAALVEEFWWESVYVAKNLRRGELLPAKYSLECVMKLDLLRRMLEWRIEVDHGWTLRPGDLGRGLHARLAPDLWAALEATFAGAEIEANWHALFRTIDLFRRVATDVAAHLRLEYPHDLDERVLRHLQRIRHPRFFELANRLAETQDPGEQASLKEELARLTFGN